MLYLFSVNVKRQPLSVGVQILRKKKKEKKRRKERKTLPLFNTYPNRCFPANGNRPPSPTPSVHTRVNIMGDSWVAINCTSHSRFYFHVFIRP